MAKLDQILLKTSKLSQRELINALEGGGANGTRDRIEKGETVLRFTGAGRLDANGDEISESDGKVELWTVNDAEEAVQVFVDFSAEIPLWDPVELENASIQLLSDVDFDDGNAGADQTVLAGKVLTFDGAKVVLRDPPGIGEGGAILETLNNVGDVNYGFYAADNKFGPQNQDILYYQFNQFANKYEWAPTKLTIDLIDGFSTRSNDLVLDTSEFNGIEFGNPVTTNRATARFNGSGGASVQYRHQVAGTNTYKDSGLTVSRGITLRVDPFEDVVIRSSYPSQGRPGFLKYGSIDDVTDTVPGDEYFTTLKHVKGAIAEATLGTLSNVNDTGILQGQVLTWDSLSQQYRPASGIAPDLSLASIEDLDDVTGLGKGRGKPLTWDTVQGSWVSQVLQSRDLKWDYNERLNTGVTIDPDVCEPCDEDNLGAFTVADNKVYVCLKVRSQFPPEDDFNPNDEFDWVKILVDGYNRTEGKRLFSPEEYSFAYGFEAAKDPLKAIAYEGSLGALSNVSTADVFPGAAPVYNPGSNAFEMGYPALDLENYSVGQLGDVNLSGAGVGYGLLWNGEQWYASSLDQKVRLDDLQDVQFGSLGVTNTKLVAAYMMVPSDVLGPTYEFNQDVSTTLAVSTPKDNYQPGSTAGFYWRDTAFGGGGQAPSQGGTAFFNWRPQPPMSVSELLDLYIRWPKDNSWQTIDGDGCIEVYFYPTLLLDNRTLIRRVSDIPGTGGYLLQLDQTGALRFSVTAPTGEIGFTLETVPNYISINNWHHVALVKEGASNRMYVDGDLIDEASSTTPWTGDGMFVMGRNDLDDDNTLTHHFFRGYMSDLRVTKGRSKYSGPSYTLPASIEAEIVDTTPNAGDFLSYDGTRWTNVGGVDADISNKSVNELADVDTGTNDPVQGDALVWTGAKWEPGIPGIGAIWSLNDMTDVETFYQSAVPTIRFSQGERLLFSNAFNATPDSGQIMQVRSGNASFGIQTSWNDCSWTCNPDSPCGSDGKYSDATTAYVMPTNQGQVIVRSQKMIISNIFYDCFIIPREYHEPALHYAACPDRGPYSGPPGGDIGNAEVEDTFIPCWGVIEDHIEEALAYGRLEALKDVSATPPTLGQALAWNGTAWAPTSSVAADVSNNELNDLGNVDVANAQPLDVLKFNGATWIAEEAVASIADLPDVGLEANESRIPLNWAALRGTTAPNGGSDPQKRGENRLDFSAFTGIQWGGNGQGAGGLLESWYNGSTVLTSTFGGYTGVGAPKNTQIELNPYYIRFGGYQGDWGTQGLLIGDNFFIRYENQARTLEDYGIHDVAPKGLLLDFVNLGLANLDLSPNTLEQLGNVDTTGKAPGYALVWDGTYWAASQGVSADISLSTIGELRDITVVDNTDPTTNDGTLTFDVGELRTSRPHQSQGGIELTNENNTARIGWSGVWDGSPILSNSLNSNLPSFVRVQELEIQVQAAGGLRYAAEPGLTDSTIPSWQQVKQQIARQASDYSALFFMDGNSFTERNYGWDLNVQATTQPNPQFFSPFADQYSYNLRKINQDKFSWSTANGAPFTWNSEVLWAVEMWVFISAADAGDNFMEFLLAPVGNSPGGTTSGLHLGLCGDERNRFFFTLGSAKAAGNGAQARPPATIGSPVVTGLGNFDEWNHLYVAHEGSGRFRMYLNGEKVGEIQRNSAFTMEGGLSFGGREQETGAQTGGYLTAALDDIRITRGWIPYKADTDNIPVPVEPLAAGAWKASYGTLDALEDVQSSEDYAPTNGQVLTWNSVAEAWRPASDVAYDVSANSISDLADVDTSNSVPDQDDILKWDVAESAWRRTKVDGNGGVAPLMQRTATPGIVPTPQMLKAGELFLNMADKRMFALDSSGTPFPFATGEIDENGILDAVDTRYDRVVGGTF